MESRQRQTDNALIAEYNIYLKCTFA